MQSKTISTDITVDMLRAAIASYERGRVAQYLEQGVLEQVDQDEKTEICRSIAGLKDQKLVGLLKKKTGKLEPEWFQTDGTDYTYNLFVCKVFRKYRKAFAWKKEEDVLLLFEIAVAVNDTDTVSYFIKHDIQKDRFPLLAAGSEEMFALLMKQNIRKWDSDRIVAVYVAAASAQDGQKRVTALVKKGVDPATVNQQKMTAESIFAEQIKKKKYAKNRTGEMKKSKDQQILRYLHRISKKADSSEKKPVSVKRLVPVFVLAAIVVIAGVGYGVTRTFADASASDDLIYLDAVTESEEDAGTTLLTDTDLAVEDGDTVNIDYTGYVDDVAFDGGSTNGNGTDLVIGSGSYIDDFEEQLIGHYVGETVTVEVTFPDSYGNEELQGKDAVFDVTINGIYGEAE